MTVLVKITDSLYPSQMDTKLGRHSLNFADIVASLQQPTPINLIGFKLFEECSFIKISLLKKHVAATWLGCIFLDERPSLIESAACEI